MNDLETALDQIQLATEALNETGTRFKEASEINKKAEEIKEMLRNADDKSKKIKELLFQTKELLKEAKTMTQSVNPNDITDVVKKILQEELKSYDFNQNNKKQSSSKQNDKSNTENYIGKRFGSDDFYYVIQKHYGRIDDSSRLELNMVSWNGGLAKYDIRKWSTDHETCSKGITLGDTAIHDLKNALNKIDIDAIKLPKDTISSKEYKIIENIVKIPRTKNKTLQINLARQYNGTIKFDMRSFTSDGQNFDKSGVIFDKNSLQKLKDLLNKSF